MNPEFDDRGHAWTVFFGVAAILIAALVLVSRALAAFDGSHPGTLQAAGPSLSTAPVVAAAESTVVGSAAAPFGLSFGGDGDPPAGGGLAIASPTAASEAAGFSQESSGAPASVSPVAAVEPATPTPPTPAPTAQPATAAASRPPAAPIVSAQSVAIIERSCGALVYGKNQTDRLPPASLTKIISALVAADRATNLNAPVFDTHISAKQLVRTTDSSVMGIEPGMTFTVRDLMYGLLLPSGNDAALQLAEYLTGSEATFVALMNARAASIGMNDTQFLNPHGLDAQGQFSTALDMAKAGRAFLANSFLAQIAATPTYETPGPVRIVMNNGNRLLQTYAGAFGVKIGYTTNARQTFVAAADRGGRDLIISLMGSDDRYADATALLDWAFANRPSACS